MLTFVASGLNVVQFTVVSKHGSKLGWHIIVHKCIPVFHALHIKMSLIFNNFKLLNSGSVCALYLLFVIILIARFCNLDNLSHSNPQEVIANCKWDEIKEQYISFVAKRGNNVSVCSLHPVCEISCWIFFMHENSSSWIRLLWDPKNWILSLALLWYHLEWGEECHLH